MPASAIARLIEGIRELVGMDTGYRQLQVPLTNVLEIRLGGWSENSDCCQRNR